MRSLSPLVQTSTRRDKRKKIGRGFSLGELKESGISITEAKRKGIPVDRRRKTVHPWNVEALKKLLLG